MNKLTADKNKTYALLFAIACVIYGCLCFYLYYNQLGYYKTGLFESDTPVHVKMAVVDGFAYSLTAYVYIFCSWFPIQNVLIALFLSVTTALSVWYTKKLVDECCKISQRDMSDAVKYLISFASNFVMGFYIQKVNVQHYIGYQNANMWHNSTYICMRLLAVLVLIKYLKIYSGSELKIKDWFIYALLLALSTGVKPSFLIVFAPVMALELIWDLKKGIKFGKVFYFACSVIPSLLVIVLQSLVLFGDDTGNGYALSPFTALAQRGDHPKITLILSILFPVIVFLIHIKDFYRDRLYTGSLLVWLFGFLEVFLFTETGTRGGDSNFMWGYSISLFILFLISIIKLYGDIKASWKKNNLKMICAALGLVTFLWHTISGIWYFVILFSGVTYFI